MNLHVARGGAVIGIWDESRLEMEHRSGQHTPDTMVWADGWPDWKPIGEHFAETSPSAPVLPPPLPTGSSSRSSKASRRWIGAAVAIAVVLLLIVTVVGTSQMMRANREVSEDGNGSIATEPTARTRPTNPNAPGMDLARRPIPQAPKTKSKQIIAKEVREFYQRQVRDAYQQHGHHDSTWDSAGVELINAWIERQVASELDLPSRDYSEAARKLLAGPCDDPLLRYVAARGLQDDTESKDKIRTARLEMKGRYPAFLQLLSVTVESGLYETPPPGSEPYEALIARSFSDAINDGSIRGEDGPMFHRLFARNWGERVYPKVRARLISRVKSESSHSWLYHVMAGQEAYDQAWRARGSGYANTVSQQGWKAFAAGLESCSSHLQKAWNVRSDDSFPAATMIGVCMGLNDEPAMRTWFDRAVTAQFDDASAYHRLRWGLRPRWGGSVDAILEVGRQALATGRFDTDVPFEWYRAVKEVSDEEDENNLWKTFPRSDVFPGLTQMYEGYIAAATNAAAAEGWRTSYALVAYIARKNKVAREQLEALQWHPRGDRISDWGTDYSRFHLHVAALTGPAATEIDSGSDAENRQDWANAIAAFERAEKKAKSDPMSLEFLRHRLTALRFRQRLETREAIPLPVDEALSAWLTWAGNWRRIEAGLEVSNTNGIGNGIYFQGPVGPNWEMEGDIDFAQPDGPQSGGFIFGLCEQYGPRWYNLTIRREADHTGSCEFGTTHYLGVRKVAAEVGLKNHLRARLTGHRLSLWLNGKAVIEEIPPILEKRGFFAASTIGFGTGKTDTPETTRYLNWKIRMLKASERAPTPSERGR